MMDFDKELDEANSRIRENIQKQQNAAEAERQLKLASERAREEEIIRAHGVAVRFTEKCIAPVIKQIQMKIPYGTAHQYTDRERGFTGWSLDFAENEYLAIKVYFGEQGIQLSAEACCLEKGKVYQVYHEVWKTLNAAQFDENEKDALEWTELHALGAFEAFGKHAAAVRNAPSFVTYSQG